MIKIKYISIIVIHINEQDNERGNNNKYNNCDLNG